jgi:hypothetical protein
VKPGAVSQFSCKGNSDGGPSFFTQNKTNFYKEIRAGSDDHSHWCGSLSKESEGSQIEASDFALAPQINPRGVCDRAHSDIRLSTPKRLNQ